MLIMSYLKSKFTNNYFSNFSSTKFCFEINLRANSLDSLRDLTKLK